MEKCYCVCFNSYICNTYLSKTIETEKTDMNKYYRHDMGWRGMTLRG